MSEHVATSAASQISVDAVVVRCTCGAAQIADADWHGRRGEPCPQGRAQDLGQIAYWSRNPMRRWAWRITHALRGLRGGRIVHR